MLKQVQYFFIFIVKRCVTNRSIDFAENFHRIVFYVDKISTVCYHMFIVSL